MFMEEVHKLGAADALKYKILHGVAITPMITFGSIECASERFLALFKKKSSEDFF